MAPQQPCRAEGWMGCVLNVQPPQPSPWGSPCPGGGRAALRARPQPGCGGGTGPGAAKAPWQPGRPGTGRASWQCSAGMGGTPAVGRASRGYCRSLPGPGAACVEQPTAPDRAGPIPPRRPARPGQAPACPAPARPWARSKNAPHAGVVGKESTSARVLKKSSAFSFRKTGEKNPEGKKL